ncbi:hypothetical protein LSTR_LSTR006315 [Laodelphax striatellus]|uniref:limulus clotting factor C n=1 Tax=Laodelphax striatellus TaxID=195883 RepID=A0A482XQF3_LAOST|nr:hypothetical protein LSTR_LSTR006315 [Laodelphax striatellus]
MCFFRQKLFGNGNSNEFLRKKLFSAKKKPAAFITFVFVVCVLLVTLPGDNTEYGRDCGIGGAINYRQPRNYSGSSSQGRIVNGKESQKGAWPWQVSLQVLHPKLGLIGHWCGGVLVHPLWILTAAHCIHNDIFSLPLAALWTVVLGDWDRERDERGEQRIPVEDILVHEKFNNYQNDIALLKLSRPVSGRMIRAVCLDKAENNSPRRCIATGWGRTTQTGKLSGILRQVRIPVHDNELCKAKYGPSVPIQDSHLCAGKLDGSTGACIGDSGGPLQCSQKDGRWYLLGITSFGSGCAKPGYPDVYTRLSFYLPWINGKIQHQ